MGLNCSHGFPWYIWRLFPIIARSQIQADSRSFCVFHRPECIWMVVSNIFFSPLFGEDFQFDEHIFQMGWNHLVYIILGRKRVYQRESYLTPAFLFPAKKAAFDPLKTFQKVTLTRPIQHVVYVVTKVPFLVQKSLWSCRNVNNLCKVLSRWWFHFQLFCIFTPKTGEDYSYILFNQMTQKKAPRKGSPNSEILCDINKKIYPHPKTYTFSEFADICGVLLF